MRSIVESVILKKTNNKKLIVNSNHILEKISKDSVDSISKNEQSIKKI